MINSSENDRRVKDARASLASAEKAYQAGDFRIVTPSTQLCIELSAKSVIAFFAEPAWRHDPGKQLLNVLDKYRQQATQRLDDQTRANLVRLAKDADEVAQWHGWSTYGRSEEDGVWIAAVDLCTKQVAEDLLTRARRSLEAATTFIHRAIETEKHNENSENHTRREEEP